MRAFGDITGKALKRVVRRIERPDDLTHLHRHLASGLIDLGHRAAGLSSVCGTVRFRLADHHNPREIGAQLVMHVAGDACPLLFCGVLQFEAFELSLVALPQP